jgi:hypothetical protein
MKLANLMRKTGWLCFALMWIPFGMIMYNGPLAIARYGPERAEEMLTNDFIGQLGIWIALLTFFMTMTFLLIFGSSVVTWLSNRRIISRGLDAEAKILKLRNTGMRINRNPVVDLTLEVRPVNGQPVFVTKTRSTIQSLHIPSYQPGKTIRVKYVPGTDRVAVVRGVFN